MKLNITVDCTPEEARAFLGLPEGAIDIAGQLADLGTRWETPRIAYKPFPVCHFMHGSLGAAAAGANGRVFAPEEIDHIVVTVPEAGVSLSCTLDGTAISPCTSPYSKSGLAAGSHTFALTATDAKLPGVSMGGT